MLGITDYLWRVGPANPVLLRVVQMAGKRKRDLAIRCGYLGLLVFFVIFALLAQPGASGASLTALSNASRSIFASMSYLQLGLVALLAPIFTAGAITQEKDSNTYEILLTTPLSNAQIVLGTLLSRLFFIMALLLSGLPVFSVTQIFGGVSIRSIVMSLGIAAATATVTAALAMSIATFKVGTRRTIFSFYLLIVVWMVGFWLADKLEFFHVSGPKTAAGTESHISWFTGIHPFLALRVVLGDPAYQPPDVGMLPAAARFWPASWYLTSPASFYITVSLTLSAVMVLPSILLLRRLAQSTTTLRSWALNRLRLSSGNSTRKPRTVWHNPVAWREARTQAFVSRTSLVRWTFIAAGIIAVCILAAMFSSDALTPPMYIDSGSYDPQSHTLFIHGDATYGLANNVKVTLGEKDVGPEAFSGRFQVLGFQKQLSGRNTRQITAIQLAPIPRRLEADQVRMLLLGIVILELAAVLLIVTNAAASAVTREKEDGSLDLLLSTPITSRYYIWGKLRGLVSFVLPLLAMPVASVMLFVILDCFRRASGNDPDFRWIVLPESILAMPPILLVSAALASMLGMQMSLRCRSTVRAVMSSVGIVTAAAALLVGLGQILLSMGRGNPAGPQYLFMAFSPFTLLWLLIDPYTADRQTFWVVEQAVSARRLMFLSTLLASVAYAALVWKMYSSMVKNFDMTIRKQSR